MKRAVAVGLLALLLAGGTGAGIGVPEPTCKSRPVMACCAAGSVVMAGECCTHKDPSVGSAAHAEKGLAKLNCNCESHTPVGATARSDESYTLTDVSPVLAVSWTAQPIPSQCLFQPQGSIEPTTPPPRS
ncbi:MAG: hypothetical protein ACRENN_06875 [Candidatus Eiseniibacteriota bacterium]